MSFLFERNQIWDRPNAFVKPHPLLAPYIAHYTVSFPAHTPSPGTLTLIPDASGCMVFRISANKIRCDFWGATTKTMTVFKDANWECLMFFVEFLPCGAQQLFDIDFADYTDHRLLMEQVSWKIQKALEQSIEKAETLDDLVREFDCFFLQQIKDRNCTQWPLDLLRFIQNERKIPGAHDIAAYASYSERHISRLLRPALGLTLKQYLRLLRVNKAVQHIKAAQIPLTELAQQLGYYDQAHFNHDFKRVCGSTPTQYRQKMSDFYNEEFKF